MWSDFSLDPLYHHGWKNACSVYEGPLQQYFSTGQNTVIITYILGPPSSGEGRGHDPARIVASAHSQHPAHRALLYSELSLKEEMPQPRAVFVTDLPTTRFPIWTRLCTCIETRSESIDATLRRRQILFAGFQFCGAHGGYETAAEVWDVRRIGGGGGCVGGQEKECGWSVSWTTSESSASTLTSGRLQPRTRGNGAGRRNKGRNVSWRNGSLQRNSQGWTTTAYCMPECDGKDQGEDIISPTQARARAGLLAIVN